MNSRVELILRNITASTTSVTQLPGTGGYIDLYPDEPITLVLSNADVKDITKRKTGYSKQFKLPGTANNNRILGHLFSVTSDGSFDPRKKCSANILVDSESTFDGIFQLNNIEIKSGNDGTRSYMYSASVYEEQEDLISKTDGFFLEDLSYSEMNHIWSGSSIISSWSGNCHSPGYYYPAIDYGYNWSLNLINGVVGQTTATQFYPAGYVRNYFERIMSGAGFTVESRFLTGTMFSNIILPSTTGQITLPTSFSTGRTFHAQLSANTTQTILTTTYQSFNVEATNDSTNGNFDNGGLYNVITWKYSADTYSIQKFIINVDYEVTAAATNTELFADFYRSTFNAGVFPFDSNVIQLSPSSPVIRNQTLFSSQLLNNSQSTKLYPCVPGETFWVKLRAKKTLGLGTSLIKFYSANTYWYNEVTNQVTGGQNIPFETWVPKKVKQSDFLKSIFTLFNLYTETSKNDPKRLIIEPRDDFYRSGKILNWTNKVDFSQTIVQDIISNYQPRIFKYKYADDADWYNTNYLGSVAKTYGQQDSETGNDFSRDEKIITTIFASTPIDNIIDTSDFIIPKIAKLEKQVWNKMDIKPRILFRYSGTTGLIQCKVGEEWMMDNIIYSGIPYCGMYDHPITGSTSLTFGDNSYEYFPTPNGIPDSNLFNVYHKNQFEEITNKDARLIIAWIYLTPTDIKSFSFKDQVFLRIENEGGSYYIVNSIEYVATSNKPSKVELIKTTPLAPHIGIRKVKKQASLANVIFPGGGSGTIGSVGVVGAGIGSVVGSGSFGGVISGTGNGIGSGSPNSGIIGGFGNVIVAGITGTTILGGNFISASTRDTTYVPNLIVQGTINGIAFSAITGSTSTVEKFVFTGSTGYNSIIANNFTSNLASGTFALAAGSGNTAAANYGMIMGGRNNFA